MKKRTLLFLVFLAIFGIALYAASMTTPVRIKNVSAVVLLPENPSRVFVGYDAAKKWRRIQSNASVAELLNSEGIKKFQGNYIFPLLSSMSPRASNPRVAKRLLKLFGKEAAFASYSEDNSLIAVTRIGFLQKIGFKILKRYLLLRKNIEPSQNVENAAVYKAKLSAKKTFYFSLLGNYLIISNKRSPLRRSILIALGKRKKSFGMDAALCRGGFAHCFPDDKSRESLFTAFIFHEGTAFPYQVVHVFDKGENDALNAYVRMFGGGSVNKEEKKTFVQDASAWLPKDTQFLSHIDFSMPTFSGMTLKNFLESKTLRASEQEIFKKDFTKDLLTLLDGRMLVSASGMNTLFDGTPLPDFTLMLPYRTGMDSKTVRKKLSALLENFFQSGIKEVYKKKEKLVYGVHSVSFINAKRKDALAPTYALTDKFLIFTVTREMMEKVLAVKKGYLPCFRDASGFKGMKVPETANLYFYSSGDDASEFIKEYFTRLLPVASGSGFLGMEVKEAFLPASEELKRFSSVSSVFTSSGGNVVEGKVEFAFKKN